MNKQKTSYKKFGQNESIRTLDGGTDFDEKNTANDWVTYMMHYMAEATKLPWDKNKFHTELLKAVAIGVAALETLDRNYGLAPRHYDVTIRQVKPE